MRPSEIILWEQKTYVRQLLKIEQIWYWFQLIKPQSPDLYWDTQKELYLKENAQTYRLTIYNEKLYVLNQGISRPNIGEFVFDEWGEFSSKYLVKKNTFNNKLKTNIELYVNSALGSSNEINAAISDSDIKFVDSGLIYDEKDLAGTFAGRGSSVIKNILELKETIKYFGNSEASLIGSVDYIASFAEFLYACSYSRVVNGSFFECQNYGSNSS